jgi:hypothetical protein
MTTWLFGVFDRYLSGEVVDLQADLRDAEQVTHAYLDCLASIPPIDPNADNAFQTFFQQVQTCQASAGSDS